MQVGQWSRLFVPDVPSTLHIPRSTTGNDDRQIAMVVNIRITHSAAVEVKHMVQQRSVPFSYRLQLLQKSREERNVELIDPGHLRNLIGIVAVVRQWVMRFRNADLGISPVTGFSR